MRLYRWIGAWMYEYAFVSRNSCICISLVDGWRPSGLQSQCAIIHTIYDSYTWNVSFVCVYLYWQSHHIFTRPGESHDCYFFFSLFVLLSHLSLWPLFHISNARDLTLALIHSTTICAPHRNAFHKSSSCVCAIRVSMYLACVCMVNITFVLLYVYFFFFFHYDLCIRILFITRKYLWFYWSLTCTWLLWWYSCANVCIPNLAIGSL